MKMTALCKCRETKQSDTGDKKSLYAYRYREISSYTI